MNGSIDNNYLGRLEPCDRMYDYLKREIFPSLGSDCSDGIRVFRTDGSNEVYIYEERKYNIRVVGKFFFSRNSRSWVSARHHLHKEWQNIHLAQNILDKHHHIASPLGCNEELNCLLVVEYCSGESLTAVINRTLQHGDRQLLMDKLSTLAGFMAQLHNRSAGNRRVNFGESCSYFARLLQMLTPLNCPETLKHLYRVSEQWAALPEMYSDNDVLVHGDATPANFFFGDGGSVISFDLERMKRSDRIFDIGRLTGELQHFFLRATGNKYLAEPYISHFLREYATFFPDRDRAFEAITARLPFYMGMNLLRIARNGYLPFDYRRKLIREAELCLQRR